MNTDLSFLASWFHDPSKKLFCPRCEWRCRFVWGQYDRRIARRDSPIFFLRYEAYGGPCKTIVAISLLVIEPDLAFVDFWKM